MKHRIIAFVLFAVFVFSVGIARADQVLYVKDADGNRLTSTTAIDNKCAWPNLTLMPDGSVVAIVYGEPTHGTTEGHIECWASEDKGKTWSLRGVPAPHEPGTNRMNHAAGVANNGDLVVLCSGWSNHYPPGQQGTPLRAYTMYPWVSRSSDGGRTWTVDKKMFQPPFMSFADGSLLGVAIPFGDILPGKDGRLHASVYLSSRTREEVFSDTHTPRPTRACVLTSSDDGRTWGDPVMIDSENVRNETAILPLVNDGTWLAASRSGRESGQTLGLYRSEDDGENWAFQKEITSTLQHPGHLCRLQDGRILLTYGNRANHHIDVLLSDDEGLTWSDPLALVDFRGDGGYPSSVQLDDGRILTAYYSSLPNYAMRMVDWQVSPVPEPGVTALLSGGLLMLSANRASCTKKMPRHKIDE